MPTTLYATAAEWAGLNPFVPANVIGKESDTGKEKPGGTTGGYWNSLSYTTSGGGGSYDFNTLPTGTAVTSLPTASTLMTRDSNGNAFADAFIPTVTSTATAASTTTLTVDDTQIQIFTGTSTQTVKLPTTSVKAGRTFVIINQSTGLVTIQSSGANTITYAAATGVVTLTANVDTPTTAANWTVAVYSATSGYTSGVPSLALRDSNNILSARAFVPSSTSTVTSAGTQTMTITSPTIQIFTGSTTHILQLPTTTVILGHTVYVINKSSGAITVNSSGGNLVATVAAGATAVVMANQTTPTTAAHWSVLSNGGVA